MYYYIVKKYLFNKVSKFRFDKIKYCSKFFFLEYVLEINKSFVFMKKFFKKKN